MDSKCLTGVVLDGYPDGYPDGYTLDNIQMVIQIVIQDDPMAFGQVVRSTDSVDG